MEMLNTIGISMNMLGLVLIFVYGISPMTPQSGKLVIYTQEELKKKNTKIHKKEKQYYILSYVGLVVSLLGMLLQIISIYG